MGHYGIQDRKDLFKTAQGIGIRFLVQEFGKKG